MMPHDSMPPRLLPITSGHGGSQEWRLHYGLPCYRAIRVRDQLGLSRKEVAKLSGISVETLARIDVGGGGSALTPYLAFLVSTFGVDARWLLTGMGEPPALHPLPIGKHRKPSPSKEKINDAFPSTLTAALAEWQADEAARRAPKPASAPTSEPEPAPIQTGPAPAPRQGLGQRILRWVGVAR
jgi:transcriptional regulator with XRE-family HTH domain